MPLRGVRCGLAWLVCAVPVLMGFVAPVAFMLRPLASDWSVLPWGRFLEWAWNSVRLGGITAGLAVVVALALAFAVRRRPDLLTRGVVRLASVGYAVPGAVIVVGLLLPVGWLQDQFPNWGWRPGDHHGGGHCLGLSGTVLCGGAPVGAKRLRTHTRQSDDSARMLGPAAADCWPACIGPCCAAQRPQPPCWFCGCDERTARHHGAAPFNSDTLAVVAYQLARDERLGEGGAAFAGAGPGGAGAGGVAQPDAAQPGLRLLPCARVFLV